MTNDKKNCPECGEPMKLEDFKIDNQPCYTCEPCDHREPEIYAAQWDDFMSISDFSDCEEVAKRFKK